MSARLMWILTLVCFVGMAPSIHADDADGIAFFEKKIRPVLADQCYSCHGPNEKKLKGNLRLDSAAGWLQGGDSGPAVVPKEPEKSPLIHAVRRNHNDFSAMPPDKPLSKEQVADLVAWVKLGAPAPTGGTTTEKPKIDIAAARQRWPFTPIPTQTPAPTVKAEDWPRNSIDRFILAKLEERGLKPVGDADKRTLIRRATFDLTGLPPTPEEIDAFLADRSPEAFAKLIDRLLASPHYGERWGRHWLDVVRYADTAGDNSDYPIPQMYLYRNWVIDAINRDLPYDQFIREQLAGDLLKSRNEDERAARIIATGYIANARRFGSRVDDYPQHLTIEDTLDNLGRAFLGLTINCARCHDHKFDPVTMSDYYALYGIFNSTRYPWPGIELDKKQRDLVTLPDKSKVYAVAEGKKIGDAAIQYKGDPEKPGDRSPRRFLAVLGGQSLPADETGSGRKQLADWLSSANNPLTARVMANRLWHYHFGRGLVATPNDFGKQGRTPTHPELLDYLARSFIENGWSMKAMHRQIMLSRTYQLASTGVIDGAETQDANNDLLGRFRQHRLDAESIRDSLLAISGKLDRTPGGAHPFTEQGKWDFTQHKPFRAVYDHNKRSVYLMTQRIQRHPYLAIFDGPDTGASTANRVTSTTTLQSLYLLNDPFVHVQAEAFAKRIQSARSDDRDRIDWAYRTALGRGATRDEIERHLAFLKQVQKLTPDHEWESFARTLFRLNEFVYID